MCVNKSNVSKTVDYCFFTVDEILLTFGNCDYSDYQLFKCSSVLSFCYDSCVRGIVFGLSIPQYMPEYVRLQKVCYHSILQTNR